MSKNLFRMFRNESTTAESFHKKFLSLKEQFDKKEVIHLDTEYHQQLKSYIERLFRETCQNSDFDNERFQEIKHPEMSQLNRLQKLKNGTSYKKEKHKAKHRQEDWG